MGVYTPAAMDAAVATLKVRSFTAAKRWARTAQDYMRANAPWQDQNSPSMTGLNSRQSLEAEAQVEGAGDVHIVLRGTNMSLRPWGGFPGAPVNMFLELGTERMSPYPIIAVTRDRLASSLRNMIQTELE